MRLFNYCVIFLILLLNSCTIAIPLMVDKSEDYTHAEYMNRFETKQQVLVTYGPPTSKETLDGIEFWKYDLGSVTNSNSNVGYNNLTDKVYGNTSTTTYNKYVQFMFADNDNVINWKTKGVNYGYKKHKNPGGFGFFVDTIIGCVWALITFL